MDEASLLFVISAWVLIVVVVFWCVLQPWNPYKPLPPTPVSELRSSSSSTESLPTDQQQSPSPRIPSTTSTTTNCVAAAPATQPEVDPYHSLSSDGKTFVNNLTAMGFSRSRASRAVEKFGPDEREVGLLIKIIQCFQYI